MQQYDTIIIGGGFYGLSCAAYLNGELGISKVLVVEKEPEMMTRASYSNQARVHNGYHYPRSVLTALRSRVNFPVFTSDYSEAVVSNFNKYYAVASKNSKVNAKQFELFCKKIGADIEVSRLDVKKLFNEFLVDGVFRVKEYAFNSRTLRNVVMKQLDAGSVDLHNNEEVISVEEAKDGLLVHTSKTTYKAKRVLNCGYSQINKIHHSSGLPLLPFKHELTEMCLVRLPVGYEDFSVTVMDGPFFSIMPFPDRGLSTLSHVRYTPHTEWHDDIGEYRDGHRYLVDFKPKSNFRQMQADVQRFIPGLANMVHEDSLWEVKTILKQSEGDDSRPILFKPHFGLKNYTCIMGGKLDNIYDVLVELRELYIHGV